MDAIFEDFSHAQKQCNGNLLSQTLSPSRPNDELRAIWKSCNAHDVKTVIKRGLQSSEIGKKGAIPKEELQGWVEVYTAYWKAVGEIFAVRDASGVNSKVSATPPPLGCVSHSLS